MPADGGEIVGALRPRRLGLARALGAVTDAWPGELADLYRARRIVFGTTSVDVDVGGFVSTVRLTIGDLAEAWTALAAAGVIPMDAVDDAGRRFGIPQRCPHDKLACHSCGVQWTPGTCDAASATEGSHPTTVANAVALASDWPGVLAAEQLAHEAAARLRPWGCPQPTRVVWRTVEHRGWNPGPADPARRRAAQCTRSEDMGARFGSLYADAMIRWSLSAAQTFQHATDHDCHASWEIAARDSTRLIRAEAMADLPDALVGRTYAQTPSPWAPLVALWATGYALDAVTDDAVTLVAPSLAG